MEHDLVDEYRLMINPIVLGSGRRLFKDGSAKTALRLVDSKTTSTGVVILTYQAAGKVLEASVHERAVVSTAMVRHGVLALPAVRLARSGSRTIGKEIR